MIREDKLKERLFSMPIGICEGDRVMILRKCKTHEQGWNNSWVEEMDKTVGAIGIVKGYTRQGGIESFQVETRTKHAYVLKWYPYFVLRKIHLK